MDKPSEDPRWVGLSHGARRRLLAKYRDVDVGWDWWDHTYELFIADMDEVGVYTHSKTIFFSGFWSQGDGAAFGGTVDDWGKVFRHLGLLPMFPFYHDAAYCMRFKSSTTRNNMTFDSEFSLEDSPYDQEEDPLRYHAWRMGVPSEEDLSNLEDKLREMFEGAANKLYKDLESEYEFLTDDERIIEYLLDHEAEELEGPKEEEEECG